MLLPIIDLSCNYPAYFDTQRCTEYHCIPLMKLLVMSQYHATMNNVGEDFVYKNLSNSQFKSKLVPANLHIVTIYFDARCINYQQS